MEAADTVVVVTAAMEEAVEEAVDTAVDVVEEEEDTEMAGQYFVLPFSQQTVKTAYNSSIQISFVLF